MKAVVSRSVLCGAVNAPPSKSFAHRHLICAMLSGGGSVCNIELSEDIRATLRCMSALGAKYVINGDTVKVTEGIDKDRFSAKLDCGESGSTLRFFIPICIAIGGEYEFSGTERLLSRPLDAYNEICQKRGIGFDFDGKSLKISGKLKGGCIALNGSQSSQFISGLLMAAPLMDEKPHIALLGGTESKPYVDITVSVLAQHGVHFSNRGNVYSLLNSSVEPVIAVNEGDWSNSAYLYAFTFYGGNVRVGGLEENSIQGDKVCLKLFGKLAAGCPIIDIADCPDLFPALAAVAALNNGAEFVNTRRLKLKESDRATAMAESLRRFGCTVEQYDNNFVVEKSELHAPKNILTGYNDHRIVMALCILASAYGGTIDGCEAVSKSFPRYFEVFRSLGGNAILYE